jgi:hypothetical protein
MSWFSEETTEESHIQLSKLNFPSTFFLQLYNLFSIFIRFLYHIFFSGKRRYFALLFVAKKGVFVTYLHASEGVRDVCNNISRSSTPFDHRARG